MGNVVRAADIVGDHHEPDRRLFGIDRPVEGLSVRLLPRLEKRLAGTAYKPSLIRRYAKGLDRFPIRIRDRPKRNHPRETRPTRSGVIPETGPAGR